MHGSSSHRPERIFAWLGVLAAAVGVLTAVLAGDDDLWQVVGAAIIGLASALVAVAAVSYVWTSLGGDPLQRTVEKVDASTRTLGNNVDELGEGVREAVDATESLRSAVRIVEDTYRTGVRRVHPRASDFGSNYWVEVIEGTGEELDMMGWTLRAWWDTAKTAEALERLLAKNVRIRVLLMDPDSPLLDPPSGVKTVDDVRGELQHSLRRFQAIQAKPSGTAGELMIRRAFAHPINWHVCRSDDRAVCMPYFRHVSPSESPVLEVERTPGGLLLQLQREFDFLWDTGRV